MQIPIDSERFNRNIKGAVGSFPENDFGTGQQKEKQGGKAWVIEINYRDEDEMRPQTEVIRVKYTSPTDPEVASGGIVLGGVKCQSGTNNGKLWISFSCDSFTQESRPSTRRQAAEPAGATA